MWGNIDGLGCEEIQMVQYVGKYRWFSMWGNIDGLGCGEIQMVQDEYESGT